MLLRLGGRKRKKSESSHILTSPDNNHSRGENLNTIARIETSHTVNTRTTRSRSNSAWNQSAPISPVELSFDNDKDDHYPPLPTFLAPSPEPTRPPPIFAPSYRRFSFPIRPPPIPATHIIHPINSSQKLVQSQRNSSASNFDIQLPISASGIDRPEQTSSLAVHDRTPYTTPSPAGVLDPQSFAPRLSQIHRGWTGLPDEMATLTATNTHLSSPQRSTSPIIVHNATPSARSRPRNDEEVFPGANALRLSMDRGPSDLDIMKMQRRNLDPRANSAGRDSIDLDIERGLQLQELRSQRPAAPIATTSAHSRNQSAATSNATDGNGDDLEDEWNDSHPCYPHRNPYVPHGSPLYEWTRIIRVPRDFMLNGDITPGFSNIYPQIMEPYVSEEQFRTIIGKVNRDLREAFDPFNWRNILDGVLGVMTCWLWEDIKPGGTFTKRKLEGVEEFLEDMSRELRRESGEKGVDIISLRRTGYANLDFQIPNPMPDEPPTPSHKGGMSRPGTGDSRNNPMPGYFNE